MMKKTVRNLAMLIALVSFAACEQGQDFTTYDEDNDGMWSEAEFNQGYEADFAGWDIDGDSYIDDEEFYETGFGSVDVNEDDMIDEEEWNEGFNNLYGDYANSDDFDLFDGDADGFLDKEEWNEGFSDSSWFDSYDNDGDGYVDTDELDEGIFNDWDLNDDGFLDEEEYNSSVTYNDNW